MNHVRGMQQHTTCTIFGIILTSVLSSLPAWRFIDPLPILSSLGSSDASQETLVDIVTDQNETNLLSPEALNLEGTAK